jgi:hypothetical protein
MNQTTRTTIEKPPNQQKVRLAASGTFNVQEITAAARSCHFDGSVTTVANDAASPGSDWPKIPDRFQGPRLHRPENGLPYVSNND